MLICYLAEAMYLSLQKDTTASTCVEQGGEGLGVQVLPLSPFAIEAVQ